MLCILELFSFFYLFPYLVIFISRDIYFFSYNNKKHDHKRSNMDTLPFIFSASTCTLSFYRHEAHFHIQKVGNNTVRHFCINKFLALMRVIIAVVNTLLPRLVTETIRNMSGKKSSGIPSVLCIPVSLPELTGDCPAARLFPPL